MCCSGGSSAPPPDPAIGQAEKEMADLQQQEYSDYKNIYMPQQQAQVQQQMDLAKRQEAQYEQTQQQMDTQSADYYNEYKNTYEPLMNNMVSQASNYDTQANYEQQAQLAIGDVNDTTNAQRKAQAMQMESVGVDPTSGAYQSMWNASGINQAAQQAAAATRARVAAQQLGWNMEDQAAAMGQNLPGNSTNSASVGLNAGNATVQTGQQQVSNSNLNTTTNNSAMQGMASTQQGIGQLGNASYQTQVNAWNAQQQADAQSSSGLGSMVGALGGAALKAAPALLAM